MSIVPPLGIIVVGDFELEQGCVDLEPVAQLGGTLGDLAGCGVEDLLGR
jgi:hypothetical protein